MKISTPETRVELERYYDLRWRILRQPWNQPRGSEKDPLEGESVHVMASEGQMVLGVGRGQLNTPDEAQIRYMAVDESQRGRGVGSMILFELEKRLAERGAGHIVLDARESAVGFYEKHGYSIVGESHTLFGAIPHKRMRKTIRLS
ncbi:MAG: GNAT family N-acetyltransferase [Candidatus Altiarchaeota archaeon]